MYEYEGTRRITYDFGEDVGRAVFVPVCPDCGRFVKPGVVRAGLDGLAHEPNAECSLCGPVEMLFVGFL